MQNIDSKPPVSAPQQVSSQDGGSPFVAMFGTLRRNHANGQEHDPNIPQFVFVRDNGEIFNIRPTEELRSVWNELGKSGTRNAGPWNMPFSLDARIVADGPTVGGNAKWVEARNWYQTDQAPQAAGYGATNHAADSISVSNGNGVSRQLEPMHGKLVRRDNTLAFQVQGGGLYMVMPTEGFRGQAARLQQWPEARLFHEDSIAEARVIPNLKAQGYAGAMLVDVVYVPQAQRGLEP